MKTKIKRKNPNEYKLICENCIYYNELRESGCEIYDDKTLCGKLNELIRNAHLRGSYEYEWKF